MDIKKKLLADIRRADFDFGLIQKGDRIMVGVSGGKDSMVLLYLLSIYQKFADKDFTFVGIMLDLGFPKSNLTPIDEFAKANNIDFRVADASDVYPILRQHMKGQQLPCSICSRMKKAAINKVAHEYGFTKVSFAHHIDDAIETLLMNMTHGGRIASFAPKMYLARSKIEFVRPLIYCREKDISALVAQYNIPTIKSTCTNDRTSERATIKKLLAEYYVRFPDSYDNFKTMFTNKEHFDMWFEMLGFSDENGYFYQEATTAANYQKAVYIRSKVFIAEQHVPALEEFDEAEERAVSYIVTRKDRPVATLRIIKTGEKQYLLGRLAVLSEYRHQGVGQSFLHYIERILSQKETPIIISLHAQIQARGFYEKAGYQSQGEIFEEAGIKHIFMQKTIEKPIMDKAKNH